MAKLVMSDKTKTAEDRAHKTKDGAPEGTKEKLPMGRREGMPQAEHGFADHNKLGNPSRRGKNLKIATKRFK